MNKSFLAALFLGCALTACSSNPSDLRPSNKVSLDQVPPGSRDTDIYNMDGSNSDATPTHGAAGHDAHGTSPESNMRKDVMPNHDGHKNDVGPEEVPAAEKTTDADQVENHE